MQRLSQGLSAYGSCEGERARVGLSSVFHLESIVIARFAALDYIVPVSGDQSDRCKPRMAKRALPPQSGGSLVLL